MKNTVTAANSTSTVVDTVLNITAVSNQLDFITMGVASNALGMTKHNIKSNIAKYDIETSKNADGHNTVNIVQLKKALMEDTEIDKVNITTKASDFIHNPMNYEGGKGKLLNKIISMFPSKINRFIEPFGGALTVGLNVVANEKLYNEKMKELYSLVKYFKDVEAEDFFDKVSEVMKKYDLYQGDFDNYVNLKDAYNKDKDKPLSMFYTLILFGHHNRIRHDKINENITTSFGYGIGFNESLLNKFVMYGKELYKNDAYKLFNMEFEDFIAKVKPETGDFLYFDPPYPETGAEYNKDWNSEDEDKLHDEIDKLAADNINFAYSTVFEHNGDKKEKVKEWAESKGYNITHLNHNYSNTTEDKPTDEVLITNYGTSYSAESIEILKKKTFITQGSIIGGNIWNSIVNAHNDAEQLDYQASALLIQSEGKKFKGIQKRVDIGRDLNIFKEENKDTVGALGIFKDSLPWSAKTSENYMKIAKDEEIVNFVQNETNINTSLTYNQVLQNSKKKGVEFMAALNGNDEAFKKMRKKKKTNISDEAENIIDKHKDNVIDKFKGQLPDDRLKTIAEYSKNKLLIGFIEMEINQLSVSANNPTFENHLKQAS